MNLLILFFLKLKNILLIFKKKNQLFLLKLFYIKF